MEFLVHGWSGPALCYGGHLMSEQSVSVSFLLSIPLSVTLPLKIQHTYTCPVKHVKLQTNKQKSFTAQGNK